MFDGVCCVVELALESRVLPDPVLWNFTSSLRWVLFSRRTIGVRQVCINDIMTPKGFNGCLH
jgi:hypothetical protein